MALSKKPVTKPKAAPKKKAARKKGAKEIKPSTNGGVNKELIKKAMDFLASGNSTSEVKRVLLDSEKGKSENYINKIVNEANKRLSDEYGKDKNEVIAIHVQRYNKDIVNLLDCESEIDASDMPDFMKKNKKITSYYQALSSMFQKEKVLQMHSKSFQIFISNKVNYQVVEEAPTYDLSALTMEQKTDFLRLILKSKKNDIEMGSVILRTEAKQEETIDVQHEEVKEEANITKIKKVVPKQIDPPQVGTALLDAKNALKRALEKAAIKEFKKAGSTTVQQDAKELRDMQQGKTNRK